LAAFFLRPRYLSNAFFINSISSVYAGNTKKTSTKSDNTYQYVVGCGGKIYGGKKSVIGGYVWEIIGPNGQY
jgi:hypothetical protein